MLTHPNMYAAGYYGGARLRSTAPESVIDKALREWEDDDGYFLQLGTACYAWGFSDGWHGVDPLVPPKDPKDPLA